MVHFSHGECALFASDLWCKDGNAHALVAHINPYVVNLLIPQTKNFLTIKSLHRVFIWKVEAMSSLLQVVYMTRRDSASTGFATWGHFTALCFGGGGFGRLFGDRHSGSGSRAPSGHLGCFSESLPKQSHQKRAAIWRRGSAAEPTKCVQVTS